MGRFSIMAHHSESFVGLMLNLRSHHHFEHNNFPERLAVTWALQKMTGCRSFHTPTKVNVCSPFIAMDLFTSTIFVMPAVWLQEDMARETLLVCPLDLLPGTHHGTGQSSR